MGFPVPPSGPTKEYTGGCHCGRFRFKFHHIPFEEGQYEVNTCSCSICAAKDLRYVYCQLATVEWISGSFDELTEYKFHTNTISHHFCSTCGVQLMEVGLEVQTAGINVRTMDGIDLARLKLNFTDGKNEL